MGQFRSDADRATMSGGASAGGWVANSLWRPEIEDRFDGPMGSAGVVEVDLALTGLSFSPKKAKPE